MYTNENYETSCRYASCSEDDGDRLFEFDVISKGTYSRVQLISRSVGFLVLEGARGVLCE